MPAITYQSVAKTCNQLQLLGDKPSVRKIREKIGGSHTVIAEHLKAWRAETQWSESTDRAISEELQKAILAEFAQVAAQVQSSYQETMEEKNTDLQETMAALNECELKYRQQELQLDEIKKKLHNDTLEFEKKLAACESTVSFLKDREIELQKKCALANEKAHEAEIKTAVANTKADNFQTRIKELEQQLREKHK
jgi:chromosome segregation ATPase